MTYIRTPEGWRYLAVWIDLYSRRAVGWAMGTTMETTLVLEALKRALGHRQIEPEKLLIHTDQGSQYRANAYRQMLEIHKITPSMSAKGCCWDNAVAESFFSTLKHELDLDDNAKALNTPHQLRRQLAFWIDGYYNRERRHSTIGYVSPINYEQQFISAFTLTTVEPSDLSTVTARKDDAAAADQAATAKVAVSVSAAWDGGLIQTTPG